MRRVGIRALMAVVGVALLVVYAGVAYLGVRLLAAAWFLRVDLLAAVAWATALAVALGYLSYRFGTARLLSQIRATDLPRSRAPRAHARLDSLVERMDAERPRLLVARMATPNALALDAPGGGALVVDRRLFRLLSGAEFEALLAHELAHLESRDALVQTLAYSAGRTLVWAVVLPALPFAVVLAGVGRALAWLRGRPPAEPVVGPRALRYQVGRVVMVGFVGLTLAVLAHSRRREFAADERAVEVTGDPLALARALRKIERASTPRWGLLAPLSVRGDEEGPVTRLLSTHPSMDERVERLLARAESEQTRVVNVG
ncbi:M48 family metalloprotease [Halorussus salilacus]|uniref:M48 family metallopeptidase n=1 Tax=Halorussus salilacus TaxID=2953750 RepID=UPI00209EF365|nr:M48 family metalloprotease [Halorussus salilacus]USZ68339.1 M48 family metalloprotease [Halorussus salilacus]